MKLYIDVDGVLLGKADPRDVRIILARHVQEFLDFALDRFDCHWLTTHCRGDARTVLDYLRPYAPPEILERAARIAPTTFRTLKVEALEEPFWWLDDSPLACELEWLRERGLENRWIQVDTRKRPDDLLLAVEALQGAGLPTRF